MKLSWNLPNNTLLNICKKKPLENRGAIESGAHPLNYSHAAIYIYICQLQNGAIM